jgi:glycosyltransferase involved in cell wall biosynthesis
MISVIIPIYNASKYLTQCLESIRVQTYKDFEVLLIDDGSTDNSAEICHQFVQSDNRFSYYHKENGGVCSARNYGLDKAQGEWIHFSDADDEHPQNALEIFSRFFNDKSLDVIMGSYIEIKDAKEAYYEKNTFELNLTPSESINILLETHRFHYQGYLWNKVFRTRVIKHHHLLFNEKFHLNEDRLFCIEYMCIMSGNTHFTSIPVYKYLIHDNSTIRLLYSRYNQKIYDDFETSIMILDKLKSNKFPKRTINLGRDRILDSYDWIRHILKDIQYQDYNKAVKSLRHKAIEESGGVFFYIINRIRRFLSKQLSHIIGRKIYIEYLLSSSLVLPLAVVQYLSS